MFHDKHFIQKKFKQPIKIELLNWFHDCAIPFWLENGIDKKNRGFYEALDLQARPLLVGFKRTRVTARQIYVFSHSAINGCQDSEKAAQHGINFLLKNHALDNNGTWNRTVKDNGDVLDPSQDLYDIAFVLFALAWWYKLSGEKKVLEIAKTTIGKLTDLKHPSGNGYLTTAEDNKYLQNPHMHLFEALLELYLVSKDDQFIMSAKKIKRLFEEKFLVRDTLREYFNEHWVPADGLQGLMIEPGHMAEWAWLIGRYANEAGEDCNCIIVSLMDYVNTTSLEQKDNLLPDTVYPSKRVCKGWKRLWPQTELLKGKISLATTKNVDETRNIINLTEKIYEKFIKPAPKGGWLDHFNDEGELAVRQIPASSLYHLSVALNEVEHYTNNKRVNPYGTATGLVNHQSRFVG